MVNAKGNSRHGHGIATHHPDLVRQHVLLKNSVESMISSEKLEYSHEHKQYPFSKTAFGKEGHIKTSGRPQKQHYKNIHSPRPAMDGPGSLQNIS